MIKNWVLTVTTLNTLGQKTNRRHYINGVTRAEAVELAKLLIQQSKDFPAGISLVENMYDNRKEAKEESL